MSFVKPKRYVNKVFVHCSASSNPNVDAKEIDRWHKQRGWPESIKLTTIKPSGTLSLLGGATPGVHPSYSKFYNRTVRMSSGDKLVQVCKDLGYHVEFLLNLDGIKSCEHWDSY